MSNRTIEMSSEAAEYLAAYLQQIDIICGPGTEIVKAAAFMEVAGACLSQYEDMMFAVQESRTPLVQTLWRTGEVAKSLFANLPNCWCPVIEADERGRFLDDGIPTCKTDIRADRTQLMNFARVQMRERFGVRI